MRDEVALLRAEIQIGLAAGYLGLDALYSDICEEWGLCYASEHAAKDCNRLCDRTVTIRLTTMCHLTDFMVARTISAKRRLRPCADPVR